MLVQEELGIPMDKVTVVHGDTDLVPVGVGTYASRSLQLGGSAVYKAAVEVKDEGQAAVLAVQGELDLASSATLEDELGRILERMRQMGW